MIKLRKATIDDLTILQYWDRQEHVIAATGDDDDWNWEVELVKTYHWRWLLIAELHDLPIGFIQIIDPAIEITHYWGSVEANKRAIDIWIGEKENLGKGYGTQMMNLALELCFQDDKVNEVLIDPLASNQKAIRFYKKLGFEFLETRIFDEETCAVHVISRQQWLDKFN